MENNNEETKEIKAEVLEPKEVNKEVVENNVEESSFKVAENQEDETMTPNDKKHHTKLIVVLCTILFLVALVLSTGFAILDMGNNNIVAGVKIRNIDISGLTVEQAKEKVKLALEEENSKTIKLNALDTEYTLTPSQLEWSYNLDSAIEKASQYGKNENIFINNYKIILSMIKDTNINLEISYNNELLDKYLQDINAKLPNAVVETNYYIDNEANELIIRKGTAGNTIDMESTRLAIINELQNGITDQLITINTQYIEPKEIDIDEIYNEVYCTPQDAYYTKDPFKIYEEVNGIDFDKNAAANMLNENKEEYVIPLIITEPEITISEIGTEAFPDLLGTCTTRYDSSNKSRTTNLVLATNKIDGVVVKPGEIFSYNKTLGERTYAAGYRDAAGYAGGKVVQMIGGGICQISSTLYDAAVFANLEIVERYNHMFVTSYLGAGKDATVSYGTLDFRFKNTREYPIMIKATSQNGVSKIDIYGIKEDNEYEIAIESTILNYIPYSVVYQENSDMAAGTEQKIQGGMNGCKSITYKTYKQNGLEVKKEVLSTDTYNPMNKIIMRGTAKATETQETVTTDVEEQQENPSSTEKPVDNTEKPENTTNTTNTINTITNQQVNNSVTNNSGNNNLI